MKPEPDVTEDMEQSDPAAILLSFVIMVISSMRFVHRRRPRGLAVAESSFGYFRAYRTRALASQPLDGHSSGSDLS